jgi:hypothetical protein
VYGSSPYIPIAVSNDPSTPNSAVMSRFGTINASIWAANVVMLSTGTVF